MEEKSFPLNNKMCRLCPKEDSLSDLFHPRNSEVRKVINLFVNIEDESSTKLPKFICEVCEQIVQSIIDFSEKCKERDNELRGLVESNSKNLIKIEDLTQNLADEILPIEVLIIKEEENLPDESVSLVEYMEQESSEEEKKPKKKTDWPCLICKQVYPTWLKLNEHKKADHLQCPVCLKIFKTYALMSHHKGNVHVGDAHCHICGKHILNRSLLSTHIRSVHNMERNHKCEICGAAFFFKSKMKMHLLTHNNPNSEICDFENCGKKFKNIINLNQHKKTQHFRSPGIATQPTNTKKRLQPPKTIVCQYCGKILKTITGYKFHILVHKNERPFKCSGCDKKFRDKSSLTVHERIHKNERPYQCDLCQKTFIVLSAVKKHKISVHQTEMKHECHICGKRTKIKSNLTLHMKIHGIGSKKNDLNKIIE